MAGNARIEPVSRAFDECDAVAMDRRCFFRRAGSAAMAAAMSGSISCAAVAETAAIAELKHALAGTVLVPGSPEYGARAPDYNLRVEVAPAVIALCARDDDVAACVRWAKKHAIPIRMRSGGHSYEGFSLGRGIVIDVSQMHAVKVYPDTATTGIQAGARLGEVYAALSKHGLALAGGACPSVGIAGLTLGGGYGLLSRKWGLTSDNLISLTMVDAGGRILEANAERRADLFWASRGGGGGNFGVVTALDFRVHPVDKVALYSIEWPAPDARQVLQAWQDWAPFVADDLTCNLSIVAGADSLKSTGQFVGSKAALRELIKPLASVGSPQVKSWTTGFMDAARYFGGPEAPKPVFLKGKSDYALRKLSSSAIDTLLSHLQELHGAATGWIQFDNYGGAVNRVPANATAFVHRAGTLFSAQYNAIWNHAGDAAPPMRWIREFYRAMRPYFSGYCYVNYCDLDLTDWQTAYYGSNFKRLTTIKARYDPGNLFRFPQSIPRSR